MVEEHHSRKGHAHLASLYALIKGGPVLDAPEAAREGGVARRRAADALNRLHRVGVVRKGTPDEVGWQRHAGSGADPKSAYCLGNSWGYAVGVSAGHRGIGTGLIDARAAFREHGSSEALCLVDDDIEVGADYQQTLQAIAGQIFECFKLRRGQLQQLGTDTAVDIRAITIGVPGQIDRVRESDPRQRRVVTVLKTFRGKPLAADLGARLAQYENHFSFDPRKIPIRLENDADCAAVGELHWGEGVGCQSLLVIKVSAGIGAGIIIDGRIHYGHVASTGEIGHDPVHPAVLADLNKACPDGLEQLHADSPLLQCSCSLAQSNHLEAYASATAVTCRVLSKRRSEIQLDRWRESLGAVIQAAVVDEDERAVRAINDAGLLVGRQINTLATALGPERVLVIGPLTTADELFLGAIHDQIEAVPVPMTPAARDVRFGTRGEAARWIGVRGAARLALEEGVWGPRRTVGTQYTWPGYEVAEARVQEAKNAERNKSEAPKPGNQHRAYMYSA